MSNELPKNMLGFLEREIDRPHRHGDKDYRSYRPVQTTTSSTSTSKPKLVGAAKFTDLSKRLEKAISNIVGTSTVATKKKTPSKTVKPKKKTPPKKQTPPKKKTPPKSKPRGGGGAGNINITKPLTTPRNRQIKKKPFDV